ncbi:UNVERIFIED_CONTAM: hypothetical protein FKN15_053091 [Acipenser sinensis]
MVEQEDDEILKDADVADVAFLVVGDPFGATTHSDLVLRAVKAGISYRVIHNASIMNAVGCCGLQVLYGDTVVCTAWIARDIKVKEQSVENLIKGRKIYEPPRYMSVNQASEQLLEIIQNRRGQSEELALSEDTICVGLSRVGAEDQKILAGPLKEMASVELGSPLHSLIISGHLHPLEIDMLKLFAVSEASFENLKMTDSSTFTS